MAANTPAIFLRHSARHLPQALVTSLSIWNMFILAQLRSYFIPRLTPSLLTPTIFLRHSARHLPQALVTSLSIWNITLAQLRSYLSYLAGRNINPTHSYSPSSSGTSYVIVHLEHVHTCTTSSGTAYVIVHTSFTLPPLTSYLHI